MGLKVASEITIERKVIVREPVNGTAFRDQPITVNYRIMKNSEEDALYQKVFVAPLRQDFVQEDDYRRAVQEHEAQQRTYARQLLREVITGWPEKSGIEDADGNPLPFSPVLLNDLLELPYAVTALVKGYREAVEGKQGARGN